jgi:signal transduction histidine kinase
MVITVTPDRLKKFEVFQDLPIEQLQWFINHSETKLIPNGELLFEPDQAMDYLHVILSGKLRILIKQQELEREIYLQETGEITGILPYSRAKTTRAKGVAVGDLEVLSFHKNGFNDLICLNHELTTRFVHEMTSRVRELTQLQTQNEKMMALGKLSAGLAHELNNPASAIVRSSASLLEHLQLQPEGFKQVIRIKMTDEQVDAVNQRLFTHIRNPDRAGLSLSMMERSACEDELVDWFDQHGIENGYELAENFVEFGLNEEDFEFFKSTIPDEALSPVLNWINSNLITEKMVGDIQDASKRIADLVSSVKNFTHMDRGHDKQLTDLHTGLRNTLTMLNHKLRKNNIELVEEFQKDLPKANVFVSELNQVWTNLIDNAIDALENTTAPKLELHSRQDGDFIKIQIIDNGPGIPEDLKNRIFDPFFTTKEIGKGTGLGLDVVNKIIAQHNGKVTVQSVPGRTSFEVCIPIGK